jgi:hypothetical protein
VTTLGNHRSGTEPVRAQSAHGLRLVLSVIFAPVFLAAAGLLAWWAAGTGPDGRAALCIVAAVCAVFFVIAAADAFTLWRRGRH